MSSIVRRDIARVLQGELNQVSIFPSLEGIHFFFHVFSALYDTTDSVRLSARSNS